MNKIDEQASGKEVPHPSPSRMEEARRLIEEYARLLKSFAVT